MRVDDRNQAYYNGLQSDCEELKLLYTATDAYETDGFNRTVRN